MGPTASEGRRAADFITLKIHRPRPGLNPRTLSPVASTLTTRPPMATYTILTGCKMAKCGTVLSSLGHTLLHTMEIRCRGNFIWKIFTSDFEMFKNNQIGLAINCLFDILGFHGGETVNMVFWVVTPCRLVGCYQRFGGKYCIHL
jgi:hypothetical protein